VSIHVYMSKFCNDEHSGRRYQKKTPKKKNKKKPKKKKKKPNKKKKKKKNFPKKKKKKKNPKVEYLIINVIVCLMNHRLNLIN